jgi:NAD(P)H-binding
LYIITSKNGFLENSPYPHTPFSERSSKRPYSASHTLGFANPKSKQTVFRFSFSFTFFSRIESEKQQPNIIIIIITMVTATTTSAAAKKIITIIGATGGTGLCLVKQALDGGHKVIALVRNPEKLAASLTPEENGNANLLVCKGDVTKYDDVKEALTGVGWTTGAKTTSTDLIVSLGGRDKICSEAQPVINKALNDVNPDMRMVRRRCLLSRDSFLVLFKVLAPLVAQPPSVVSLFLSHSS